MPHDRIHEPDRKLIERFENDADPDAFTELVNRHGRMVLGTAYRVLGHRDDADDAMQATFMALAKGAKFVRNKGNVAAWLHSTAWRCAMSIRRRETRRRARERDRGEQQHQAAHGSEPTSAEQRVETTELAQIIDEELAQLSAPLREAVVLCDLEGRSRREVADLLGLTAPAVGARVAKAHKSLQRRLVRRGVSVSVAASTAALAEAASATTTLVAAEAQAVTEVATKFALGLPAKELGISTSVLKTATGVVMGMKTATCVKWVGMTLTALAVIGVLSDLVGFRGRASAGVIRDDFSDGSITDGMPATWVIFGTNGEVTPRPGSVLLTATTGESMTFGAGINFPHRDITLEMVAQFESAEDMTFLFTNFRDRPDDPNSRQQYATAVAPTGEIGIFYLEPDGNVVIPARDVFLPSGALGPDDIFRSRTEIIGATITHSVWLDGDDPSSGATIIWTDPLNRVPTGEDVSFSVNPNNNLSARVVIHSFEARTIPEPTTASLSAVVGILVFGHWFFRGRRRAWSTLTK